MELNLEFQVSEIFPSLIIKDNVSDCIDDIILSKVDNIIENMSEKIPLSEAFSSRKEVNDLINLSKFENLKKRLIDGIIKYTIQQYQIKKIDILESFVVHVPKDGYFELRKNYNSSFHLLINLSSPSDIVLQNPIYLTKSLQYDVNISNKYNSQYSFSHFDKYESTIIPSGIYYGFPKREEDLKFITIVLR